jgi:hypothetical protein
MLQNGVPLALTGAGFKIRFDRSGKERIACIASDQEIHIPNVLNGVRDLTPVAGVGLDSIVAQFRQANPNAAVKLLEITVQ